LDGRQRREFHEALLEAATFEDLLGRWQAAIIAAEQNRLKLRLVSKAMTRRRQLPCWAPRAHLPSCGKVTWTSVPRRTDTMPACLCGGRRQIVRIRHRSPSEARLNGPPTSANGELCHGRHTVPSTRPTLRIVGVQLCCSLSWGQ
jgi:hypothetical protein